MLHKNRWIHWKWNKTKTKDFVCFQTDNQNQSWFGHQSNATFTKQITGLLQTITLKLKTQLKLKRHFELVDRLPLQIETYTPRLLTSNDHCYEVQNSRVTKSSYETKLRKMMPHFELLTRKFL